MGNMVIAALPAPLAYQALMALSKGRYPTPDQREARARLKQALLDAGYPVDSEHPRAL